MSFKDIQVIAFDADDTLWENENFFREAEQQFCELLKAYQPSDQIMEQLFKVEVQNMEIYGYGIKAFILSLVETSLLISDRKVRSEEVEAIINIGKTMLNKDVVLLDGIRDVLEELAPNYRLVLATKGDLLDQERKLKKSGLLNYFHHIEVMTHKKEANYESLLDHLDIEARHFMMIGNSLKSDVLPVINLGGTAVHVPYYTTWVLEQMNPEDIKSDRFFELKEIRDVLTLFTKA
ncbi:HAD family hydrolase [uncultured Sunxiuqinia sp.]|uniref:HAD family hydrolase n=1 Tax=uncultured Sunxiuqinia sp. TaxID=1573825 RepID=UPI002AA74FDC|nr:HAD family hydrolase [uncultured Sunxiuqinia sp.]